LLQFVEIQGEPGQAARYGNACTTRRCLVLLKQQLLQSSDTTAQCGATTERRLLGASHTARESSLSSGNPDRCLTAL